MTKCNKQATSKKHQGKYYKKPKLIKYSKIKTIQASASGIDHVESGPEI